MQTDFCPVWNEGENGEREKKERKGSMAGKKRIQELLVTFKDSGACDELSEVPQALRDRHIECSEYITVAFDPAARTCRVLTRKEADAAYRSRHAGSDSDADPDDDAAAGTKQKKKAGKDSSDPKESSDEDSSD